MLIIDCLVKSRTLLKIMELLATAKPADSSYNFADSMRLHRVDQPKFVWVCTSFSSVHACTELFSNVLPACTCQSRYVEDVPELYVIIINSSKNFAYFELYYKGNVNAPHFVEALLLLTAAFFY